MSKIEGIPEGFELVRIGMPKEGDTYVVANGLVDVCKSQRSAHNYPIVRPIAPLPPVYVPWTFETCPIGCVVRRVTDSFKGLVVSASESGVVVGAGVYGYETVFKIFTQLDGTPCGTIEESK